MSFSLVTPAKAGAAMLSACGALPNVVAPAFAGVTEGGRRTGPSIARGEFHYVTAPRFGVTGISA